MAVINPVCYLGGNNYFFCGVNNYFLFVGAWPQTHQPPWDVRLRLSQSKVVYLDEALFTYHSWYHPSLISFNHSLHLANIIDNRRFPNNLLWNIDTFSKISLIKTFIVLLRAIYILVGTECTNTYSFHNCNVSCIKK